MTSRPAYLVSPANPNPFIDLKRSPINTEQYEEKVFRTVLAVLDIENMAGRELPQARTALADTLDLLRESDYYGEIIINEARELLGR